MPPRPGFIHPTANIGDPPESRDYTGPGIQPIIHPTAQINAFSNIDAGTERATRLDKDAWAMALVHIGHDALVGEGCELAPGTVVGGFVTLGRDVRCGVGVIIRPRVTVGDGARLGAGAVVVADVPPGETWIGNPARRLYEATGEVLTPSEEEGWEEVAAHETDEAIFAERFDRARTPNG